MEPSLMDSLREIAFLCAAVAGAAALWNTARLVHNATGTDIARRVLQGGITATFAIWAAHGLVTGGGWEHLGGAILATAMAAKVTQAGETKSGG